MNPISLLFTFLSNPGMLSTMGGAALIALVYWFGPSFGLRGQTRLIVVLSLVVLYVALLVFFMLRKRRKKDQAAADLETSIIMEADQSVAMAEAGQKRVREDARRELVAAIDVLKKSNLADGRGGKAALYVLPWYLVMGSGYSGKSSLISNSGLQSPGKGPGELRGIGASANCEWWFTNHAVFLEADRRFTASAGAKAVEGDWETYLSTLSKQRSDTPLNGVVLTVSAAELMQSSASDLEEQARLLRKRLDTMANQLKLVFPVYLMVTKMDLVQGFNDFFAGLAGVGAEQIMGATLRADQMRKPNPEKFVAAEFDRLYQNLCRRRQMRLIQDEHAAQREGSFLFPLQFRSLGDSLLRFVQVLCEPNAYGRNPMLRGFYFVSAGGEGEASDHVLHEMSRILGLPTPAVPATSSSRPLFMRGFFRKVLVPDRDIARPTRGAARRTLLMRRAAQVAVLAVLAALIVNLWFSFISNFLLIKQTTDRAMTANIARFVGGQERVPDSAVVLPNLNELRKQLEHLDESGSGLMQIHWMGMNRGQKLNEKARELYLQRYVEIVAKPYAAELEQWLLASESRRENFTEYWRRYRVYRMLFRPTRGDPDLVADVLTEILAESNDDAKISVESPDMLRRHVMFAMSHADELQIVGEKRLQMAERVRTNADENITNFWTAADYYRRVIDEVDGIGEFRVDLGDVNQSSTMLVIARSGTGETIRGVPGSFTKRGWEEKIREKLGNVDGFLDEYAWLLPQSVIDKKAMLKSELLHYYEEDYVVSWQRFLSAVALKEPLNTQDAETRLITLVTDDSPYMQLLRVADMNLRLEPEHGNEDQTVAEILAYITGSFDALHKFQDNEKLGDDESPPQRGLEKLVKDLVGVLTENSQGGHAQKNAFTYSKGIAQAETDTDGPIGALMDFAYDRCFSPNIHGQKASKKAFESVLRLPALHAWQGFLRDTEQYLNKQWQDEVRGPFARNLSGQYPFSSSADSEIAPDVFGVFFGGTGQLQTFVSSYLAPYVDSNFKPRQIYGNGLHLTTDAINTLVKGHQLRVAFFKGDDASPKFSFKLKSRQAPITGRNGIYVDTIQFEACDKSFSFGTGKERVRTLTWPSSEPTASISVVLTTDSTVPVAQASGLWSLFRLKEMAASSRKLSPNKLQLTWRKSLPDGPGEVAVPFDLTFDNVIHPFVPDIFKFRCPQKLTAK